MSIKTSSIKSLKQLKKFTSNYRYLMFVIGIFSFIYAAYLIFTSISIKLVTDYAINNNVNNFIKFAIIGAIAIIIGTIVSYIKQYSTERFNMLVIRDIKNHTIEHVQKLPVSYFEKHHTGDIVSRINSDTLEISNLLKNISELFYQPFVFMGAFSYMLYISPKLLLATVILVPVSSILFDKISKPAEKKSKEVMEKMAEVNVMTQDTLNGAYVMKSFNLQKELYGIYEEGIQETFNKQMEVRKIYVLLTPIFLILRFIPQLVCPLYGGYLAMQGEISIGELLAANIVIWSVFRPVESFLSLLQKIRSGVPAIDRIFEIMNHPKEIYHGEILEADSKIPICFEDVSFNYEDGKLVLDHISLKVNEGKTFAIVGASGSGKSTILKLLFNFYQPCFGNIFIFGHNTKNLSVNHLRKYLAYVSQDAHIYPDTVLNNIKVGKMDASIDEIMTAAKAANCHEFIMALPNKYDTKIGKEHNLLSGGQRQRISLARAILKDAPILLLDEPTAALDTESEAKIQEALNKVIVGKTVLIVAHRLSTIKNSDEVIVLDQGRIVERGTHNHLIKQETFYKKLYQKQWRDTDEK